MVGSGVFEKKYAAEITQTRLNRLNEEERSETQDLMKRLGDQDVEDKNMLMCRLGQLISKADSYDALTYKSEILECQYNIFQSVWKDAEKLREGGKLLMLGEKIKCPVVAIHGDYDPHLCEGVREPLSHVLKDFRFIILEKCGHQPWIERFARDRFYQILKKELG